MADKSKHGCWTIGLVGFLALGIISGIIDFAHSIIDPTGYEAQEQQREAEEKQEAERRAQRQADGDREREERERQREKERLVEEAEEQRQREEELAITEANERAEVTLEEFFQIRPGMSYSQVVNLIGSEGELVSETALAGMRVQNFRWIQNDGAGVAVVTFENSVAYSKSQDGLE